MGCTCWRFHQKMKNPKTPLSVRAFKAKKYFSDKKSNIKYNLRKVKENLRLRDMVEATKGLIKKLFNNLKDNAENWKDRANADEGFLIDD